MSRITEPMIVIVVPLPLFVIPPEWPAVVTFSEIVEFVIIAVPPPFCVMPGP